MIGQYSYKPEGSVTNNWKAVAPQLMSIEAASLTEKETKIIAENRDRVEHLFRVIHENWSGNHPKSYTE